MDKLEVLLLYPPYNYLRFSPILMNKLLKNQKGYTLIDNKISNNIFLVLIYSSNLRNIKNIKKSLKSKISKGGLKDN